MNVRVGVVICVVEEIPDLAVIQDQGLGSVAGVRTGGCSCAGGGLVYKCPGLARSASGRSLRPSIVYFSKEQPKVAILIEAESVLM